MKESLIACFENICKKYSKKVAIQTKYNSITFAELHEKVLLIARCIYTQTKGRTRIPVFVYLPKSENCVAGLLGVLYSGNYYTITDIKFPFHKVEGILEELQPEIYLTDEKNANKLVENGISQEKIICVDLLSGDYNNVNMGGIVSDVSLLDPAYVLFTSGSTGKPKGAIITHLNLLNFIEWLHMDYGITEHNIFGNSAEFYFDLSCFDLYSMIGCGSTLNIIPRTLFTFPEKLMQYVAQKKINTIAWVPSALVAVANADALKGVDVSCMELVIFCGEVMPTVHFNYWWDILPEVKYINAYGPTETTCACCYFSVVHKYDVNSALPIGKKNENVCCNTRILILNEDGGTADVNEVGEICVAGGAVGLGYYGDNLKTDAVFVQNLLNKKYSEKIYRTGDLAYYNESEELMYVGRKDFQVKYKGYRIELGEIEAVVYSCNRIKQVGIVFDEEIVLAYVGDIKETDLQKYMKEYLPSYMIPSKYMKLQEMPLNQNGKVDRDKIKRLARNE